jgi:membrane protease YdiL (CAAX protease family)
MTDSARDLAISSLSAREFFLGNRFGRWRWPYALSGLLLFVALNFGIAFVLVLTLPVGDLETIAPGDLSGYLVLVAVGASFSGAAAAALLLVHRQHPAAALGSSGRFDWRGFWKGAGAAALVFAGAFALEYRRRPELFEVNGWSLADAPWVLLAVTVLFFQSCSEEYAFKGYLTRMLGALVPNAFIAAPAVALLFAALHAGNQDVAADLRFAIAGLLAFQLVTYVVYLRTENIGAPTGVHWMNNAFAICILATAPVQPEGLAFAVYSDPVLMSGGSRAGDLIAHLELLAGVLILTALLCWKRSPFCVGRA